MIYVIPPDIREEIENKVEEGAYVLDILMSDWAWHVDLSKLDIKNYQNCVLGQLFGDISAGLRRLTDNYGERSRFVRELGFDGFGTHGYGLHDDPFVTERWAYAHEMWQEAILDRRPNVLIGGEAKLLS